MSYHARPDASRRIWTGAVALLMTCVSAVAVPPAADSVVAEDAPGDAGGRVVVRWTSAAQSEQRPEVWIVERALQGDESKRELRDRRVAAASAAMDAAIARDLATRSLPQPDSETHRIGQAAAKDAAERFAPPSDGVWIPVGKAEGTETEIVVEGMPKDLPLTLRVVGVSSDGSRGPATEAASPVIASANIWFFGRTWFFVVFVSLCATILVSIILARGGRPARIRRIAGLDAVDEAIGRATEMGRPVLFIPGIQDMDNVQTVAGVTVLARVAKIAAEYDARIEVPTARSLVMTACRDAVHGAYLAAGRADAYNPDVINYITDEQFGYVAWVASRMRREKPATCIYMGQFYAESLLLAENGNAIGAIQIAGTAETSQLPFFVAACDYTLIGEEFFAASAYLSGEQTQLGSLRGQDVGKALTALVIVLGMLLATIAVLSGWEWARYGTEYLRDVVLKG